MSLKGSKIALKGFKGLSFALKGLHWAFNGQKETPARKRKILPAFNKETKAVRKAFETKFVVKIKP